MRITVLIEHYISDIAISTGIEIFFLQQQQQQQSERKRTMRWRNRAVERKLSTMSLRLRENRLAAIESVGT